MMRLERSDEDTLRQCGEVVVGYAIAGVLGAGVMLDVLGAVEWLRGVDHPPGSET